MALIDHIDGDRMMFGRPLTRPRILRRPNRFIMEVDLGEGQTTLAHCPSTGSIGGISLDGLPCLLSGPTTLAHRRGHRDGGARARFMESASGAGITPSPWFPSIG